MPGDADWVDGTSLTVDEMRFSAEQLRTVMNAIDSGTVNATGRERAFLGGALHSLELLARNMDSQTKPNSG